MRKFFHYTSLFHLEKILADKRLDLTCSNLKYPENMRVENGNVVSDTDYFKPCVWFLDILDFDAAKTNGLEGSLFDKTECAIVVRDTPYRKIKSWEAFKSENFAYLKRKDIEWISKLESCSTAVDSWYISEEPIVIDENVEIIFRPDILQAMLEADEEAGDSTLPPYLS